MKEKTIANQVERSIRKIIKSHIDQDTPHFLKQAYERLSDMGYTKEEIYAMLTGSIIESSLYARHEETADQDLHLKMILEEMLGNMTLGMKQMSLLEHSPERDQAITLRISLIGYEKRIWRRLNVRSTVTLGELAFMVLASMQATMSHLFRITYRNTRYELNMPGDPVDEAHDLDHVMLAELPLKEGDKLILDYDFGEDWAFNITIESLRPFDEEQGMELVLDGRGYGIIEDMRYAFECMMDGETIDDDVFDEEVFDYLAEIDLDLFEIEETEDDVIDAIMHYRIIRGSLD